ncbi:MAG: carbohydrate binding domain-containing protein [Methanococcaceae archaeon]
MKTLTKLICILLLFTLFSCNKNDNEVNTPINATIKGRITTDGLPVSGASVILDNNFRLSSNSDQFGKFQIDGINNGTHLIKITKYFDNGSSIIANSSFVVEYSNYDFGDIKFRNTPFIFPIDTSNSSAVYVKWSNVKETGFSNYKVYMNRTQNFDETTGELVYTTTDPMDTVYNFKSYLKGAPVYFKIYAHSGTDRIYMSNLDGVNLPARNFINNGGFENSQNGKRPDSWIYNNTGVSGFDYMKLSPDYFTEGKRSLEINWLKSLADWSHSATLYQNITTTYMIPGHTYILSFSAKSETGDLGVYFSLQDKTYYINIKSGDDWTEKDFAFDMTSDISDIKVEIRANGDSGDVLHGWIDNIKIVEQK